MLLCLGVVVGLGLILAMVGLMVSWEERRRSRLTPEEKQHEDELKDDVGFW
jgi:hypothetical protein